MNISKPNSRCRPALGTLVRVQLDNELLLEPAYETIAKIEKIFNFHDPKSELSAFNRDRNTKASKEFQWLYQLALELRRLSDGSFTPFVEEGVDLGGLAKGFAVDQAVEKILELDPTAKGFVEAGGDIRYFGTDETLVSLRLGVPPQIFTRELKLTGGRLAVATSSPGMAEQFGETKTKFRTGRWPKGTSVTVIAKTCALADALTKVVLFGDAKMVSKIDATAQALVFDSMGDVL